MKLAASGATLSSPALLRFNLQQTGKLDRLCAGPEQSCPMYKQPLHPSILDLLKSDRVSLGHLITTSARLILREYDLEQQETGISPPRSGVLILLNLTGPLSQQQIADQLFLDKTSLSTMLREMQQAALVDIQASPQDRRVHIVTLTKKGRALVPDLEKVNEKISRALESRVPNGERRILRKFFRDFLMDYSRTYG